MFNGSLLSFQEFHETNLLKACADNTKLILQSPTGSGKTVLVSKFIDDYLDENPDTVFFWFCPGAGSLQDQSRNVFESLVTGVNTGDVYDFISDYSPAGSVYFVNWDKINKSTNVVLQEGEEKNLLDKIIECRTKLIEFFMVVDEEHLNKAASDLYENTLKPIHVLRISATTKAKEGYKETISDDEVISAGLIASGISINEDLSREAAFNDDYVDDLLLLQMADAKRKHILLEYEQRHLNIRPLVLIQFPNGKDEWIARVKATLDDMGYNEKNGLVTSWFSGDHPDEPDEIRKLNGKYAFLLFKQAIATGWDCPRAKILVKLREGTTEAFDIQTIGRIRRMPERHHYDSEVLDHCYVYTLDEKFSEGLRSSINESFYLCKYMRKKNAPTIVLNREYLPDSDRQAVDEEAVVKAFHKKLLFECDLDQNGMLTKQELNLTKGFVFGTRLKTRAVEGIVRTTHDITKLQNVFCGEHEINMSDDGPFIRDAKRKIAQAIGIDESISSKALAILFDSANMKAASSNKGLLTFYTDEDMALDKKYKIITDMGHREYSAFLINNWEKIADMLRDVDKTGIELADAKISYSEWTIPRMQDYKKSTTHTGGTILEKNVFSGYATDLLVNPQRSQCEIFFESWAENDDNVEWIYKNGDKGEDYFTIVYRVAFRRYNFYPDYIVRLKNGDVWIIEAKGGATAEGKSQNIDKYSAQKFDALKEYCSKYPQIKWGFVRNFGAQLLMSNSQWDEDLSNSDVWKPIREFIS